MAASVYKQDGHFLPGIAFGKERFVLTYWPRSAIPHVCVLHYTPDNRLIVHADRPAVFDMVRAFHGAHIARQSEMRIELEPHRLAVSAIAQDGPRYDFELTLGNTPLTRTLNGLLALTPGVIRNRELFARMSAPLAGWLLGQGPGFHFTGPTEAGARLYVAARRLRRVQAGRATIGGVDCGPLRPVDDPPDWGNFRMLRVPYVLDCSMFVSWPLSAEGRPVPASGESLP